MTITDANGCKVEHPAISFADNDTLYTVTANGENKKYDGVEVNINTYTLAVTDPVTSTTTRDTIISGTNVTLATNAEYTDVLVVDITGAVRTDAGTTDNTVSSAVVTRTYAGTGATEDVTCKYNLVTNNGSVIITRREVTLTSSDSTHAYDLGPGRGRGLLHHGRAGAAGRQQQRVHLHAVGEHQV